jgi:endonuclease YncB( thermonuclease family)
MLTNCQYVVHKDNDGDSFHVKSGTNEFILRLYFVDAPEPNMTYPQRTSEQSDHFGVTMDETKKAGIQATEKVRELLREPFVVWTRWASAQGRAKAPRYYGLVEIGGTNLAEILVSQGLAQTKGVMPNLPTGEKSKTFAEKLRSLENEAKQKKAGLWANSKEPDKSEKERATSQE